MPFANLSGKFGDISSHFGMIWRFATMADPLVVEWHSRDLDSLPNPREVAAVNDWLRDSNQTFQIMRDHPLHNSKILGGAFGMRISGHITAEAPLSALKSAIATAMRPPCPGVPILGPDHGMVSKLTELRL